MVHEDCSNVFQRMNAGAVEGDFAMCMSLYHGYELLQQHGLRSLHTFLEGLLSGDKGYGRTRSELMRNQDFCDLMEGLKDKFEPVKWELNFVFCCSSLFILIKFIISINLWILF